LEHPDLLVAEMTMARDEGAGVVADQHGAPIALLPERLPVHAGSALHPGLRRGIDVEARGCRHGRSTSTASPSTRTGEMGMDRPSSTRHWPVARSKSKPCHGQTTTSPSSHPSASGPSSCGHTAAQAAKRPPPQLKTARLRPLFSTRRAWPAGISSGRATRTKGIGALGYTF